MLLIIQLSNQPIAIMMSWSQKLFLRINKRVGKNKLLDGFMIFCASWLIWVMYAVYVGLTAFVLFLGFSDGYVGANDAIFFLGYLAAIIVISLAISWLIAFLFPHHRPVTELKDIKTLIKPYSNWKSFPSDHTIFAFALVWVSGILFLPLLISACLVALGRVYVGVHYPRDILGGVVISGLVFLALFGFFLL